MATRPEEEKVETLFEGTTKVEALVDYEGPECKLFGMLAQEIEFEIKANSSEELVKEWKVLKEEFGWKKHDDN